MNERPIPAAAQRDAASVEMLRVREIAKKLLAQMTAYVHIGEKNYALGASIGISVRLLAELTHSD